MQCQLHITQKPVHKVASSRVKANSQKPKDAENDCSTAFEDCAQVQPQLKGGQRLVERESKVAMYCCKCLCLCCCVHLVSAKGNMGLQIQGL